MDTLFRMGLEDSKLMDPTVGELAQLYSMEEEEEADRAGRVSIRARTKKSTLFSFPSTAESLRLGRRGIKLLRCWKSHDFLPVARFANFGCLSE